MTMEKPATWTGASGTEYAFDVFGLEPAVPNRLGVYIYAKRNDEGAWVPIYFGGGDLGLLCAEPALQQCIGAKHATHVHLRLMKRAEDRADELRDLLARYENAFSEGCQPEADRPAVVTDPTGDPASPAP